MPNKSAALIHPVKGVVYADTGTSQTFTFVYTDPNGASDISAVGALFNSGTATVREARGISAE